MPEGQWSLQLARPRDPLLPADQTAYLSTVGLLRWLEVGGRITEVPGASGPLVSDLSAHAKLRLPLELLWPTLPVALAFGTQDEGGASSRYRTRYVVASARSWKASATLGWGSGPDRMKGLFGGLELRPLAFLHLLADREGDNSSVGARLDLPLEPGGFPVRLGGLVSAPIAGPRRALEWTVSLGFQLESLRLPPLPDDEAPAPAPTPAPTPTPAPLLLLTTRLVEAGFEDIRAGTEGSLLVVELENGRYGHSERDGVAVALRLLRDLRPEGARRFVLVLRRAGLRLLELTGDLDAPWSSLALRWHPAERTTPLEGRPEQNGRFLHGQLLLEPHLRSKVAHEYGAFDGALSFRPSAILALWPGAVAYAQADLPFAWTPRMDDGQILSGLRPRSALLHALLFQAFAPLRSLHALVGAGRFRTTGDGAIGALLWTPAFADGLALGVEGSGMLRESDGRRWSGNVVARLYLPPADLLLRMRAGRFYDQDEGCSFEVSRFFGDTEVGLFYSRTDVSMVGLQLTLPLSPRAEPRPGYLQIRGARRWRNDLATVVGENRNVIRPLNAVPPEAPYNLEEVFLDAGRLSIGRLRRGAADPFPEPGPHPPD